MSPAPKTYDIVIYGATGFTGQLCIRYLSSVAERQGTQWAVAGRNKIKLNKALEEAGVRGVDVLVADSTDEDTLTEMARATKLVISLVGPYALHGKLLVKVCAAEGVHYVDLTGEPAFVAEMVKLHTSTALSTRALLVPSCGFDSVPSDLCAYLASQALKKSAGEGGKAVEIGETVGLMKAVGGASGGTVATLINVLENSTKEERAVAKDPYGLSPIRGVDQPKVVFAHPATYQGQTRWGGFWLMAPANEPLVRRSWGLLQQADAQDRVRAYGPQFSYREVFAAKSAVKAALATSALYTFFAAIALITPIRWLVKKFGPQSGDGPTLAQQKAGWFKLETIAHSSSHPGLEAKASMKGDSDPGYSSTAKLIVEGALTIVHDYDRLPPMARRGGFLTPATALADAYVERLEKTGQFHFETEVGGKKL